MVPLQFCQQMEQSTLPARKYGIPISSEQSNIPKLRGCNTGNTPLLWLPLRLRAVPPLA